MRRVGFWLLVVGFLVVPVSPAFAIGAMVEISGVEPCPSFCGGAGSTTVETTDGGAGSVSADAALDDPLYGQGEGAGAIDGALSASAAAAADARVITIVTVETGYIYSGLAPTSQLSITLDATASGEALIQAVVGVIVVDVADLLEFNTDAGAYLGEVVPGTAGATLLDSGFLELTASGGVGDVLDFSVTIGDIVRVYAQLQVVATRGGIADAGDTLTLAFDAPEDFALIPEPATALLVLPLLVLASRRTT